MHTLFDFITHVKTVEYLLAVSFIAIFIVFWEVLKPNPFRNMVEAGREDLDHIKTTGYNNFFKNIGLTVAAPFIGLLYVIALPFMFFIAVGTTAFYGIYRLAGGTSASFGWRPTEAYLGGKKKKDDKKEEKI